MTLTKILLLTVRWQRAIVVGIVLLALGGVLWTAGSIGWGGDDGKPSVTKDSKMSAYSMTNGGFTYSLQFYKSARLTAQSQGVQAIVIAGKSIASVQPTQLSVLTDCSGAGDDWKKAGDAKVDGQKVAVCTLGDKGFATIFDHDGTRHMVTITYLKEQKPEVIKDLQYILKTVKVSGASSQPIDGSSI